jgi:putative RNA 2'-phosphotransferase
VNAAERKQISKRLSYVLRHRPDSVGIDLEDGGWVEVERLLASLAQEGEPVSREVLAEVVATSDKQRFELSEDGARIRARQGHSAPVDLGYAPAVPPEVLFHGTARHNLESILRTGLNKGRRHHVHLSTNKQTMLQVGQRHGQPALLAIAAARMHAAGHAFFLTGNQVWLTDHVPPEYLSMVEHE